MIPRLDPELYEACKEDAIELCHAPHEWHKKGATEEEEEMKWVESEGKGMDGYVGKVRD